MTGSGVQTDPYIVDNWADFLTIPTTGSVYVEWNKNIENKVIDFNDIQPEGFSKIIFLPYSVNFNGWTLKNLHSTANTALSGISGSKPTGAEKSEIKNLTIENFYFTGNKAFSEISFKNCIFSGIINAKGNHIFFYECLFLCSSLNAKANILSSGFTLILRTYGGAAEIRNSDIVLDVTANAVIICDSGRLYNSRISGKILSASTSKSNITIYADYSCVFNLESNLPLYCSTPSTVSIYNSDLATANTAKNFIGVTTEQLKDATYLASIGFPIGVD